MFPRPWRVSPPDIARMKADSRMWGEDTRQEKGIIRCTLPLHRHPIGSSKTMGQKARLFEKHKLDLVNGLFNVSYLLRTMYEFLNFACNWCIELGLVDRIKTSTNYDKIYLTALGIEINTSFSLDLQLKKRRLNLNFKYLD